MRACELFEQKSASFGALMIALLAVTHSSAGLENRMIELPKARIGSKYSLESTLNQRRSVREFNDSALTLKEISQLLWAAQGVTDLRGYRTAPSAGALYPLEIYLAARSIQGLHPAIYRYRPQHHTLQQTEASDKHAQIAKAAFEQSWLANSPVILVISAIYERTTQKYGDRGIRYVHMEAGHAAQNVFLQAVALDLQTITVGAFDDNAISEILRLSSKEQPLYLMPIGRK